MCRSNKQKNHIFQQTCTTRILRLTIHSICSLDFSHRYQTVGFASAPSLGGEGRENRNSRNRRLRQRRFPTPQAAPNAPLAGSIGRKSGNVNSVAVVGWSQRHSPAEITEFMQVQKESKTEHDSRAWLSYLAKHHRWKRQLNQSRQTAK